MVLRDSGRGTAAMASLEQALASRAPRWPAGRCAARIPAPCSAAALAAVGLPMPLLAVAHWPAAAIALAAVTGTGAILVEILTETGLQRMLPPETFGRAYGLALPASLGGIVAGGSSPPC